MGQAVTTVPRRPSNCDCTGGLGTFAAGERAARLLVRPSPDAPGQEAALRSRPVGSSHSELHPRPPEGALGPLGAPADICGGCGASTLLLAFCLLPLQPRSPSLSVSVPDAREAHGAGVGSSSPRPA